MLFFHIIADVMEQVDLYEFITAPLPVYVTTPSPWWPVLRQSIHA